MSGTIDTSTDEAGVHRMTINRPDKRNALTQPLMRALCDAVLAADDDGAVNAILLGSHGPVFCAGADLGNLSHSPPNAADDPGHQCLLALAGARKPLVAAVQGAAVGMGATMLLHFDAVFAAPEASLRMPFVELGLTPEGGATFLLPAWIGHIRAARLLMLAEPMSAIEAEAAGLLTRVVSSSDLMAVAYAGALRLASLPPRALALTKQMMTLADRRARMDEEQDNFRRTLSGEEFSDAVAKAQARLRGQS